MFLAPAKVDPNFFGKANDSGQETICSQGKTQKGSVVTCKGPKVLWGKHTGVPHKHSGNKYDTYCKSMGYDKFVPGSDKYGTVKCDKGALFGCSGYDFNGWHWCVVHPSVLCAMSVACFTMSATKLNDIAIAFVSFSSQVRLVRRPMEK